MGERLIRLDNRFVYKEKSRYYLTDVTKVSEWRKMGQGERAERKGKDVTTKVKRLLKKNKPKSNINIKTKPSKRKLRTQKKKKHGAVGG